MPLDFYKTGADTGSALDESIHPIENGEPLDAEHLVRPPENLRNRTEVIRQAVDFQEILGRSDRGLIMMSAIDAKIFLTEDGVGHYRFRVNTAGSDTTSNRDLIIGPIVSPSLTSGTAPIRAKLIHLDGTSKFSLLSQISVGVARKVAEGAHNILFRIYKETGVNSCAVDVEGTETPSNPNPELGPMTVALRIAANGSTTVAQAVSAINLHTGAAKLVFATAVDAGTLSVEMGPVRLYEDTTTSESIAGIDDECFRIRGALDIDTHFTDPNNHLIDGSFLILDFATAKDRLANSYSSIPTLLTVHPTPADGTTTNIAETQGTVPICKMLGGYCYFINSRCFEPEVADYLMGSKIADSSLRGDLALTSTGKGDDMIGAEEKPSTCLTLNTGTVDSQLVQLAGIGSSTGGVGSNLVGSADLSAGGISLTASSIYSQLSQLITQLTDQDGVGEDGASRIGAAAYEHGDETIGPGTVSSQLREIIYRMVNHFDGSDYNHQLADIQGKPFAIVAPTGGDYSTITLAINALKATGGTIFIYPGTYIESYAGGNLTIANPLHLIGFGETVWTNHTTPSTVNFSTDMEATFSSTLTFENIKFVNTSNDKIFNILGKTTSEAGKIEFYNCRFFHNGATGRFCNFMDACRVVVENCYFESTAVSLAGVWAIEVKGAQLQLHRNKFYHCGNIVLMQSPNTSRFVSATYNEFLECGASEDFTVLASGYLFSLHNVDNLFLVGNTYPDFTHSGNRYALFAYVNANVFSLITQNIMHAKVDLTGAPVSVPYLFNFVASTGVVYIQNNTFPNCGFCGSIKFGSSVISKNFVLGNTFANLSFPSAVGTELMFDASYGQLILEGNYLHSVTGVNYFPYGVKAAGLARISENIILNNLVNLISRGDSTVIRGNHFEAANASNGWGIYFDSDESHDSMVVTGNQIKARGGVGHSAALLKAVITGNVIETLDAGKGIELSADHSIIADNALYGDGSTAEFGIWVDQSSEGQNIIKGNRVKGYAKTVYTAGTATIVQDCNLSFYTTGGSADVYGIWLGNAKSQAIGNVINCSGTPSGSYRADGVYINSPECIVSHNVFAGSKCGVKTNPADTSQFIMISGNRIEVADLVSALCIDITMTNIVKRFFTITNNVLSIAGATNNTTTFAIDAGTNEACVCVVCAGNIIRHYVNPTQYFSTSGPIRPASVAFGLGVGATLPQNVSTVNMYDTV